MELQVLTKDLKQHGYQVQCWRNLGTQTPEHAVHVMWADIVRSGRNSNR